MALWRRKNEANEKIRTTNI